MTIGHLIECVFAKSCCLDGLNGDGTVFLPFDENKIFKNLENYGFNSNGNEILYNGFTGLQMNCEIFIGPTYYFRLKHMVAEKIHARDIGPKVSLTRQPTAGRRKGGGLRIGEMERDSLISHGLSQFIQESMTERSDKYEWAICKNCGTIANFNPSNNNKINFCSNCSNQNISIVKTPYSFKLLVQELEAMNIQVRLNTDTINFPLLDINDLYQDNDDLDNLDNNINDFNNEFYGGNNSDYKKKTFNLNNVEEDEDNKISDVQNDENDDDIEDNISEGEDEDEEENEDDDEDNEYKEDDEYEEDKEDEEDDEYENEEEDEKDEEDDENEDDENEDDENEDDDDYEDEDENYEEQEYKDENEEEDDDNEDDKDDKKKTDYKEDTKIIEIEN